MENLIGFVLPVFIDFLNKRVKSSNVRFVISFLVCVVVAIFLNIDKLNLSALSVDNLSGVLGSIGVIFTESQVIYKLYWDKSDLRERVVG